MKTEKVKNVNVDIDDIIKTTKVAIKKQKEQERKFRLAEEKEAEERIQRENEESKDLTIILEELKEAAEKGKSTHSIELGEKDSRFVGLQMKEIKKQLKRLNPSFEEHEEWQCSYNYEGNPTRDYSYTSIRVNFKW
jgi:hypothetical protein